MPETRFDDDVHEVDGHFCISTLEVWRPGVYDCEQAAEFALCFKDETLQLLQDKVNKEHGERLITLDMLRSRPEEDKNEHRCSHGEPIENCDTERPGGPSQGRKIGEPYA